LIIQEIMLESFAVASYARVGKAAPAVEEVDTDREIKSARLKSSLPSC